MKRWTKQEFIDATDACAEGKKRIDEYFAKYKVKTVSILTILNAPLNIINRREEQFTIWYIDEKLWDRALPARGLGLMGDDCELEAFAEFEANIRAELKASK